VGDLKLYVVPYLNKNWEDLAYQLLESKDTHHIAKIRTNNNDVETRATRLMETWVDDLGYKNITWNKLIEELNNIGLRKLASDIKDKLSPGTYYVATRIAIVV